MAPDGTPIVGRTPLPNLFLSTGHGTLGWTMSCGSGQLLADLMSSRKAAIQADDLSVRRYIGSVSIQTSERYRRLPQAPAFLGKWLCISRSLAKNKRSEGFERSGADWEHEPLRGARGRSGVVLRGSWLSGGLLLPVHPVAFYRFTMTFVLFLMQVEARGVQ